ncbi:MULTISPECIES: hypothetical protein [Okeania]|uniref:Uncharacterized protein n=1 Tax=Okeania hirsuta TaxID=1458930 RepID=A0A3N6RNY3_9CYAN|nr:MULTISPECIES: hypothetical protein [Okeania]NET15551.1 hypothetical protein [Okeania sp. SIO1H6]NES74352.1 hypothetical protein [Okeania sp. SIO1H4]NES92191.1 hypothetical protein [Okeania sp. SIO2B9]NET18373.1 hypothetical protein [Okeania sp. SIO1H5]NET75986.1 hypothetical protein [Okeania sp. SIO1F9]
MPSQPEIYAKYADGTPVYKSHRPSRISGLDTKAIGPHSVLRWDTINNRIYQRREYDASGNPVRDIDFTSPTFPRSGRIRPEHPVPPHQHRFYINDPKIGTTSGFVRGAAEPLEQPD